MTISRPQVLDVVGESVALFDEVNVATALHRLAKLQPPGTSGPQSPIVYADQFQALVEAVQRLLDRFEAQAISNTLWGAALQPHIPVRTRHCMLCAVATHTDIYKLVSSVSKLVTPIQHAAAQRT